MLKSLVSKLRCPGCGRSADAFSVHAFEETSDLVLDGVVVCKGCHAWYPVEHKLLELVRPNLLYAGDLRRFCDRFQSRLDSLDLKWPDGVGQDQSQVGAQLDQRGHFDWYSSNETQDYDAYQNTPFWRAVDAVTFARWGERIRPGSWLLDIGCADGRSAFQLPWQENHLIGFDISKKMIARAIQRAEALGIAERCTFLVGDGDRLPFADESFDYACTYGVLHHLPEPGRSCRDILRILKPGGTFFASENNKSVFRSVFDWMMRVMPLWTELAGKEPLISRGMLEDWLAGLPVTWNARTMVFLPPHAYNWAGRRGAVSLLKASDTVAGCIPGLCRQGGLIVFAVDKNEAPSHPEATRNEP